ncbi:hypothetical protein LCGC14_1129350 [marine sediment metagenome]|uniref:Uncharacterized protein n=1 Tax=marine sediment metagenome TaxID=412755 RepID=A0A0F9MPF7_9ZZZZ
MDEEEKMKGTEQQIYLSKKVNYLQRIFKRSLITTNISQGSVLIISIGLFIINFYFGYMYLNFIAIGLSISIAIQSGFSLLYFHPFWKRQLNILVKK